MSELGNAVGTVLFLGVVGVMAWPLVLGMDKIARWRKW